MQRHPINVLVTALGGGGHGEQILKALLMVESGRYRIFGADMNPHCPQFQKVEQSAVLPPARDPAFKDAVLELCERWSIQALFHGCEPELQVYDRFRTSFLERNILLPINKAEVIAICMDKIATAEFLAREGFAPPQYALVQNVKDIEQFVYPIIVKPHIGSGASKDCFILQSKVEAEAILAYLGTTPENPILAQEYVGTPETEFTVGVLHDLEGNFLNSIALRRELKSALNLRVSTPNRTGRLDLGPRLVISSGISMGEIGLFPEVTDACERVAKALDVRGAINIQGRMTPDGFKVFEINPRFSGTTSIRAMVGYNEPDVLLRRHLLGERIAPRFPYKQAFISRHLTETVLGYV